jgi:hypothetical protein
MLIVAGALKAQVPGSPVLQNSFLNNGLGVAGNYGGGTGQSFYGAGAGWGFGEGRFQLSGVAGAQSSNDKTRGAYGARAAANVWSTRGRSFGVGAFAGVGGAPRTRTDNVVTNAATLFVPAGLSVAYQRPIGSKRGISVYASPMYRWARFDDGLVTTNGAFRGAVGVDFSVTHTFGVTVGGEFGQADSFTDTGSVFGAAVTFVPRRR